MQCSAVKSSASQCSRIQCTTEPCSSLQIGAVQSSAQNAVQEGAGIELPLQLSAGLSSSV